MTSSGVGHEKNRLKMARVFPNWPDNYWICLELSNTWLQHCSICCQVLLQCEVFPGLRDTPYRCQQTFHEHQITTANFKQSLTLLKEKILFEGLRVPHDIPKISPGGLVKLCWMLPRACLENMSTDVMESFVNLRVYSCLFFLPVGVRVYSCLFRVYTCLFLLRVYFHVYLFLDACSKRVYSCLFVSVRVYTCLFYVFVRRVYLGSRVYLAAAHVSMRVLQQK